MRNLIKHRLVRYLVAGGSSYVIELGTLLALHHFAHLSVEVSTAISFWIGIVTSFLFQKLFAFKDFEKTVAVVSRQAVKYGALVAVNYAFTLVVVSLFPSGWIVISRTLALAIVTCWNYLIYHHIFNL